MIREYAVDQSVVQEQSRWSLSDLIEPIDVAEFASRYWEKQPLYIQRQAPAFYKGLLTLDDIDSILSASSLHESEVQVVTSGRRTRLGHETLEALYEQYRQGATITVKFIHRRWAPLAQLCRSVSTDLTAMVQVNGYLTPAGAQGFATHYDTHDVFIAQVHGSKHWRLYDSPRYLPESNEFWVAPQEGPGQPARELDMRPGDLLYLPRGTLHDATSNDAASLHLTIGVHPVTCASVLRQALDEVISEDCRYREALPIGFGSDEELARESRDRLTELIAELAGSLRPGPLIDAAAREVRAHSQPTLRGHLLDIEAIDSIGLDTPVRGRDGLMWTIKEDDGGVSLEFHGKVIRMPARIGAELRFAAATAKFAGRDLPGDLDEAGRIVLVSTLVREGFLTLS
jgi:ribosomal protein L16 Arg81 hydroxylase